MKPGRKETQLALTTPSVESETGEVLITGSCLNGATVVLEGDDNQTQTCQQSSFSFRVQKNEPGTYDFTVTQIIDDMRSAPLAFQWKHSARSPVARPSVPTITVPSSNPYRSNDVALLIQGQCTGANLVSVSGDATASTTCSNNAFSVSIPVSEDKEFTFFVKQIDSSGTSSSEISLRWMRDTTPPAPTLLTSPLTNPYLSNTDEVQINGICEAGSVVTLNSSSENSAEGTDAIGTSKACLDSTFSFVSSKTEDGSYLYKISQTDAVGNRSEAAQFEWKRITKAPVPELTLPVVSPYLSNGSSLSIEGKCASGSIVHLTGDATDSVVCADGSYAFTVAKTEDRTYEFLLKQVDSLGNTSGTISQIWVRDTTAPSAPTITTPAENPFRSGSETLSIAGSCVNDATVVLSGANEMSVKCTDGAYAFELTQVEDGTYNFNVAQKDEAGNVSAAQSLAWQHVTIVPPVTISQPATNAVVSNASSLQVSGTCVTAHTVKVSGDATGSVVCTEGQFSFTFEKADDGFYTYSLVQADHRDRASSPVLVTWQRDTTPPSSPVIGNPSANPYVSGTKTVDLYGTCETGATVYLAGATEAHQLCESGTFRFQLSQTVDGWFNYNLTQKDEAQNASAPVTFLWTIDSTVPAEPTIAAPAEAMAITKVGTLEIKGSCLSGATVQLHGPTEKSATCDSGTFAFEVTAASDGKWTYELSQVSATSGLASASVRVTWIVDSTVPERPAILQPSEATYASPGALQVLGSCEPDATVIVSGDDTATLACASDGTFRYSLSPSMDGTYELWFTQRDRAQNTSDATTLTWHRDSNLIPVPQVTSPSTSPFGSNAQFMTLAGSCQPSMDVVLSGAVTSTEVTSPAGSLSQPCSADGTFAFMLSKTNDGTYDVSVRHRTLDGTFSPSTSVQWTVDRTPPRTSFAETPSNPNLHLVAKFSFASSEPGSSFECQLDSGPFVSCAATETLSTLSNGSHSLSVRAKDAFGNVDPNPAAYSWTQSRRNTIALYHFDTGAFTADSSGFVSPDINTLTAVGSPSVTSTGKFNQAAAISAGKYFTSTSTRSLETLTSTMTIEMFVNLRNEPSGSSALISKMGPDGQKGWELGIRKDGTSRILLYFEGSLNGTSTTEILSSNISGQLINKGWVHVAATFNNGDVKLYVAGTLKGSGTIGPLGSSTLFNNSSQGLVIGNSVAGRSFDGSIDELRLSQVLRYTRSFDPPTTAAPAD